LFSKLILQFYILPLNELSIKIENLIKRIDQNSFNKTKKYFFICAVSISWIVALINISLPQCSISKYTEYFLFSFHYLLFFGIFGSLVKYDSLSKQNKLSKLYVFTLFLCFAPAFFASQSRMDVTTKVHWDFSGKVTEKYNSRNHNANSITINKISYEGIPEHIWQYIRVGDFITKQECNNTIILNERKYLFNKK